MVRIGLAGCGAWGKLILRDLKSLGAQVAVLAHGERSRANALAGGADHVVTRLEYLPEVDAYVVAVPTVLHAEFVERLAATGKPIFCEKPLTPDVVAARRLVALAAERIFVMDKWRYHAGVLALAAIARSGELGPVLGINTRRVQWQYPHDDVSMDWILLPHDLSITLEILGFVPEPIAAVAEMTPDGLVGFSGLLESDGVWMRCEVGIRSPTHSRVIELRCRDGVATLSDAYAAAISILHTRGCTSGVPPQLPELRPVATDMPLLKELEAFLNHVRGTAPPPHSTAAEGLLIVERIARLRQLAGLPG